MDIINIIKIPEIVMNELHGNVWSKCDTQILANIATCGNMCPRIAKCGNVYALKTTYCEPSEICGPSVKTNPGCPDPIWKPVNIIRREPHWGQTNAHQKSTPQ